MAATSDPTSAKTICVLDALDECHTDEQERLIQLLNVFHKDSGSPTQKTWLKFLVTSRPYDDIQIGFKITTDPFPHIHLKGELENDQISKEIDLVIKVRVEELAKMLTLSSYMRKRIENRLLQIKHRTYLWLYLVIDDIRTTLRSSFRPLEENIRLIPPSVNAAYSKILSRVRSDQVRTARKILQIIVGARRPLTIKEMAMALGIALRPSGSQPTAEVGIDPEILRLKIRDTCGLFTFISNSRIYLLHQTAREFLIVHEAPSNPRPWHVFSLLGTENLLGEICTRYLLMDDLENDRLRDYKSFLAYSAEHWADHVRNMSSRSYASVEGPVNRLYETSTRRFAFWFRIFSSVSKRPERELTGVDFRWGKNDIDAIQLAAFNGHVEVVERLISEDNENVRNNLARETPYAWESPSLSNFDEEEQNTIPPVYQSQFLPANERCDDRTKALILASWKGHDEICLLLLKQGTNPDPGALIAASSRGNYDVVKLLLDRGANVTATATFTNALEVASFGGFLDVVQLLLQRGIDINAKSGSKYGTALQAASQGGHLELIQFLLKNKAHVNTRGNCGEFGSALVAASFYGFHKIVKNLLEAGADVNYIHPP